LVFQKNNTVNDQKADSGKLIGKLIRKRKEENAAFQKLLTAINEKGKPVSPAPSKPKS
jgi:hypothetical protein